MSDTEGLGGSELESLLNLMPMPAMLVDPGGERVLFANDAARRRFLARAGLVLDASPDPDVALARIAALAVEGIADWCSVDVVGIDGSLRHVVSAHSDPERTGPTQTLRERYPPDPEDMVGA